MLPNNLPKSKSPRLKSPKQPRKLAKPLKFKAGKIKPTRRLGTAVKNKKAETAPIQKPVSATHQGFILPLKDRLREFCDPEINFMELEKYRSEVRDAGVRVGLANTVGHENRNWISASDLSEQQEDETLLDILRIMS